MADDNPLPPSVPPDIPASEIEGGLMRHSAPVVPCNQPSETGASPEPDEISSQASSINDPDESTDLGTRLRGLMLPNANDITKSFLPAKLVAELISMDMIEQELSRLPIQRVGKDRKAATAADIHKGYVVIFCALCAIEKGEAIWDFVNAGISDTILPLHKIPGTAWSLESRGSRSRLVSDVYNNELVPSTLVSASNDSTPVHIPGFEEWKTFEKELFIDIWQWSLTVPFFEMGIGNSALQHNFSSEVVLPWAPPRSLLATNDSEVPLRKPSVKSQGGFGSVETVWIEERCHGFHEFLEEASCCVLRSSTTFADRHLLKTARA